MVAATPPCSASRPSASMPEPATIGAAAPTTWSARARRWLRTVDVLLRFGMRADPPLVFLFFGVVGIWQVVTLGRIYAFKMIVDAALAADVRGVTIGALVYGLNQLILIQC